MEVLSEFWMIVVSVWEDTVLGISVSRLMIGVGILFLCFVLRSLIARFLIYELRVLTKRTETLYDDLILDALAEPFKLIPIAFGIFFAGQTLLLEGTAATLVQNLVISLVTFIIFWGLYRITEPVSHVLSEFEHVLTRPLTNWMVRALKVIFVLIGAAAILEVWGIQVAPLIAGAGLFGVAIALGAQDMFKNLIAGISIIVERRFSPGDWIKVSGVVEGTVENIGFRSTLVRQFDKAEVYVPNAKLSDDAVVNFTKMTHRRIYWKIGVEYRTTKEQLRLIRDQIEAFILNNDDFADPSDVSTFVRIDAFNDSSIDIMVYCFTRTTKWGEWLKIKEDLAYRIKEIVEEEAGTGFAFPSQSLYVESLPGQDGPEAFVPPTKSGSQPEPLMEKS